MLRFQEKNGVQYEYASVQFKIIENAYVNNYLHNLHALIPDKDLYHEYEPIQSNSGIVPDMRDKYGRENSPHVTVLYGLDCKLSIVDVRKALEGVYLPGYVCGKEITAFYSDPQYDVVKLDICEPLQLWRINKILHRLPVPGETFPDYSPHMTLAYVKKGWKIPKTHLPSITLHGYLEFSNNGITVRI